MVDEAGWYRDASGELRYWNGTSWAGQSDVQWPLFASARTVAPAPRWRLTAIATGWIFAIFTLGMVLTGVSAGDVDCGTVFNPRESRAGCAAELHSRTTMAGLTAAGALLCLTASSRAAVRVTGAQNPRGTPVLA